jgi:hypothetical protein
MSDALIRTVVRLNTEEAVESAVLRVALTVLAVSFAAQQKNPLGVLRSVRDEVLFSLPTSLTLPEDPKGREQFVQMLRDRAKLVFQDIEEAITKRPPRVN